MVYRSIKWHSVAWNTDSSMWCRMAQHNSRSSITSCGTSSTRNCSGQYIKRFSQPRNSWQSRVMAECDMNQQSVTLAYVRRNHQKYKMRMEQPKSENGTAICWGHDVTIFDSCLQRVWKSRLIWPRNFGVKLKWRFGKNLFPSQLAWSYSDNFSLFSSFNDTLLIYCPPNTVILPYHA